MFGKRTDGPTKATPAAAPAPPPEKVKPVAKAPEPPRAKQHVEPKAAPKPEPKQKPKKAKEAVAKIDDRSDEYYRVKTMVFNALIDTIDLAQLAQLDADSAREEIRDIVVEIISIKNVVMSIAEQESLLEDICNDVLGYGPLEPLLARDDIADIMVNGAGTTYIEVDGRIERTNIRFRDNAQLMNICQRIVSQVGRRVDESSPICDARLLDGSRVNVT
ncbi:MAG TPA: protein kinase, partial [Hyphomonadaceae bacterium]|nr:protein kinase [Hyphomonadaceae bacterium]